MSRPSVKRVEVVRKPFTARDGSATEPARLTGVLGVSAKTLSYVHVGSGKLRLKYNLEEVKKVVRKSRGFEELVKNVLTNRSAIGEEYLETVRLGGKVCIPGSTFKGLVRSRLELLIHSTDDSVESCFRQASHVLTYLPPKGSHGWRHVRVWTPSTWEDRGKACSLTDPWQEGKVCIVCDIFGAPGLSARAFFGNLCCGEVRTEELTLVDGSRGASRLEAIPPNIELRGEVAFLDLFPWELGLVLIGMGYSTSGESVDVLVGRSKYRIRKDDKGRAVRLGVVRFSVDSMMLKGSRRVLESLGLSSDITEVRGSELRKLITLLIRKAVENVRILGERAGFSEAEEILKLGGR